jgi:hypothetical protein
LMSMRSSRTLTLASQVGDSRYSSSLSCTLPGGSSRNRRSASPKLAAKVLHSQRGTMGCVGRPLSQLPIASHPCRPGQSPGDPAPPRAATLRAPRVDLRWTAGGRPLACWARARLAGALWMASLRACLAHWLQ